MLAGAAANHLSWFGRGRERVDRGGVTVFVGGDGAAIAFPARDADLDRAVECALEARVAEVGCWALEPDDEVGERLRRLGFQDGWQQHWMGTDPRRPHDVLYDMGVLPAARGQGFGLALALAALACARDNCCTTLTLNATSAGEPVYRRAGLESLGLGMTCWLLPRRR